MDTSTSELPRNSSPGHDLERASDQISGAPAHFPGGTNIKQEPGFPPRRVDTNTDDDDDEIVILDSDDDDDDDDVRNNDGGDKDVNKEIKQEPIVIGNETTEAPNDDDDDDDIMIIEDDTCGPLKPAKSDSPAKESSTSCDLTVVEAAAFLIRPCPCGKGGKCVSGRTLKIGVTPKVQFLCELGRYLCSVCHYFTVNEAFFREHVRVHVNTHAYKCVFCDFKAKHPDLVKEHNSFAHSDRQFSFQPIASTLTAHIMTALKGSMKSSLGQGDGDASSPEKAPSEPSPGDSILKPLTSATPSSLSSTPTDTPSSAPYSSPSKPGQHYVFHVPNHTSRQNSEDPSLAEKRASSGEQSELHNEEIDMTLNKDTEGSTAETTEKVSHEDHQSNLPETAAEVAEGPPRSDDGTGSLDVEESNDLGLKISAVQGGLDFETFINAGDSITKDKDTAQKLDKGHEVKKRSKLAATLRREAKKMARTYKCSFEDGNYHCFTCDFKTPDKDFFRDHIWEDIHKGEADCPYCMKKQGPTVQQYRMHQRSCQVLSQLMMIAEKRRWAKNKQANTADQADANLGLPAASLTLEENLLGFSPMSSFTDSDREWSPSDFSQSSVEREASVERSSLERQSSSERSSMEKSSLEKSLEKSSLEKSSMERTSFERLSIEMSSIGRSSAEKCTDNVIRDNESKPQAESSGQTRKKPLIVSWDKKKANACFKSTLALLASKTIIGSAPKPSATIQDKTVVTQQTDTTLRSPVASAAAVQSNENLREESNPKVQDISHHESKCEEVAEISEDDDDLVIDMDDLDDGPADPNVNNSSSSMGAVVESGLQLSHGGESVWDDVVSKVAVQESPKDIGDTKMAEVEDAADIPKELPNLQSTGELNVLYLRRLHCVLQRTIP